MKRRSIILGAVVVGAWIVVDTVREFLANETLEYFATKPVRLLHVAAIAIVGGLAALGFARLSPSTQRQVRVFAWGAAASALTLFVVWFAFRLALLASLVVESGGSVWGLLAWLLFVAVAAYLWFEFYRAMKSGVSRW
jgi:hypothetical protein